MPNNKCDRSRIALKQPHEVNYIRELARNYIKGKAVSVKSLKRVCRAWLKITKKR